jgi:hypothetical protein
MELKTNDCGFLSAYFARGGIDPHYNQNQFSPLMENGQGCDHWRLYEAAKSIEYGIKAPDLLRAKKRSMRIAHQKHAGLDFRYF